MRHALCVMRIKNPTFGNITLVKRDNGKEIFILLTHILNVRVNKTEHIFFI